MTEQQLWLDPSWQALHERKRLYVETFAQPWGKEVLADLARFCHANEVPYHAGASQRETDILIGRQEVWLHIADNLNLSTDELYAILRRKYQRVLGESK
jgi:hypothetical protein